MPLDDDNELIQARMEKLERLRELGQDPVARERYDRTHTNADAVRLFVERENASHDASEDASVAEPIRARLAGRVFSKRPMGKATFIDLRDESGRIQLYFKRDKIGTEAFELLDLIDHSDFVGAEGTIFRTRTTEVTLEVESFAPLAKAVRPLPM